MPSALVLIVTVVLSLPGRAAASSMGVASRAVGGNVAGAAVLAVTDGAAVGRCKADHAVVEVKVDAGSRGESQRTPNEGQGCEDGFERDHICDVCGRYAGSRD